MQGKPRIGTAITNDFGAVAADLILLLRQKCSAEFHRGSFRESTHEALQNKIAALLFEIHNSRRKQSRRSLQPPCFGRRILFEKEIMQGPQFDWSSSPVGDSIRSGMQQTSLWVCVVTVDVVIDVDVDVDVAVVSAEVAIDAAVAVVVP